MKSFNVFLPAIFIISAIIIHAQTVDEIISKSLAAKGGIEKIKSVQTQRMTGRILFGSGSANPLMVSFERPGKIREEIEMNGKKIIEINNGREGWVINPLSGDNSPRQMTADEVKNTSSSADLDGPLVDYKERGNQIELRGIENVNGKPAYKLYIKLANGQTRYDFIDSVTNIEVKWAGSVINNGKENQMESFFKDYKNVDGILYPFEIDSDTPGGTNKQKIVFDKIEVNPVLDESIFNQPDSAPTDSSNH
jgi:outer membrane lipoprotein-sorting protein